MNALEVKSHSHADSLIVLLMARDPRQSVTKELYPAAAVQFGATAAQVERSIRSAIDTAWQQHDRQIWQLYFTANDAGMIPRPTNSVFISRLADLIILGKEKVTGE